MSKQAKKNFVSDSIKECWNCCHFQQRKTSLGDIDLFQGSCTHSGLSSVPARNSCDAWEQSDNPKILLK